MQQIPKNTFEHSFCMVWARRLLHLYPAGWQERYADEMLAFLEEYPPTFWTLVDLLLSLCDAHLHPDLVSKRTFAPVKKFYNSIATILSVGLLFFLFFSHLMGDFGDNSPSNTPFPPFFHPIALVLHNLSSMLGISLALFGTCLLLSTGWQAFKTRHLLSFCLYLLGILGPALLFIDRMNILWQYGDVLWRYENILMSSSFIQQIAVLLSFKFKLLIYPFGYACLFLPSMLASFLLVRMGGGRWKVGMRHSVPAGLHLAKFLLVLATLCTVLLFLYCSGLLFLIAYTSLSGFGNYVAWILDDSFIVLLSVMLLLTATSLARAYQARHSFTMQTQ